MRHTILIALATSLLPAIAVGDDFAKYQDTEPVSGSELGVYLWAKSGGVCANARDDADKMACKQVARTLSERIAGRQFFWRSQEGVLSAGAYDPRRKSMPIVVESCLACDGVDVGKDDKVLIIGRTGGDDKPAPLRQTSKVFNTTDKAELWQKQSLPRLVGEYLVRIPKQIDRVKVGEQDAIFVDVEAYRIYDRCTGEVAVSKPRVRKVEVYPGKECEQEPEESEDSESDDES